MTSIPDKIPRVSHIKIVYNKLMSSILETETNLQDDIDDVRDSIPNVEDEISSHTATMTEFRTYLGIGNE